MRAAGAAMGTALAQPLVMPVNSSLLRKPLCCNQGYASASCGVRSSERFSPQHRMEVSPMSLIRDFALAIILSLAALASLAEGPAQTAPVVASSLAAQAASPNLTEKTWYYRRHYYHRHYWHRHYWHRHYWHRRHWQRRLLLVR